MPPHDQPWLAFSGVRWQGGLQRRLVRVFDDRIEVRAGRFAVDTVTIPMGDVYDVELSEAGALRIVVMPDDILVTEGTERDRALAAELIRKNAPAPRKKPKPKPKPKPAPEPPPASPPASSAVATQDPPRQRRAARALALLTVGIVFAAAAIVLLIGGFVWVVVRVF